MKHAQTKPQKGSDLKWFGLPRSAETKQPFLLRKRVFIAKAVFEAISEMSLNYKNKSKYDRL
ncbi:MAG TPA: hypothetical protein DIW24_02505 [Bacteroidetes bacterium]|nr:hypothetical protein [Bacteroidota bacterium]